MKLEGEYQLAASLTEAWEVFTNPRCLERTIPGCESLKEYEPGKYDATLNVGVAAVKGTYTGKFEIVDAIPPQQCRLVAEGSGTPGFVKADTKIVLRDVEGGTLVNYEGEVQIGGLISGVGQRMIGGIAKMMLKQYFKRVSQELGSSKELPITDDPHS